MEDKGRSAGKTVLHVLAFIGMALLLLALGCLAAIYMATKGPSEAARADVVNWASERNLSFAAELFLSDEEVDAILNPAETPGTGDNQEETPFIVVTEGQAEASPDPSEEPATSEEPETTESPAPSDNGEEAAA